MQKTLLSFLVVVVAFLFTGASFAYWDSLSETEDNNISLGQNTVLTKSVVVAAPSGKKLIPTGSILDVDDVNFVEMTYKVDLSKTPVNDYVLEVNAKNILIDGSLDSNNLIIIEIKGNEDKVFDRTEIIVTIQVSIKKLEEEDEDAYSSIKNKVITFDLEFKAVPKK